MSACKSDLYYPSKQDKLYIMANIPGAVEFRELQSAFATGARTASYNEKRLLVLGARAQSLQDRAIAERALKLVLGALHQKRPIIKADDPHLTGQLAELGIRTDTSHVAKPKRTTAANLSATTPSHDPATRVDTRRALPSKLDNLKSLGALNDELDAFFGLTALQQVRVLANLGQHTGKKAHDLLLALYQLHRNDQTGAKINDLISKLSRCSYI